MSATHTYVVTSALAIGDTATIIGTVDTIPSTGPVPVTVTMWVSAINAAKAISLAALEALVAPVMLAAAQNAAPVGSPLAPQLVATQLPTGTFTL